MSLAAVVLFLSGTSPRMRHWTRQERTVEVGPPCSSSSLPTRGQRQGSAGAPPPRHSRSAASGGPPCWPRPHAPWPWATFLSGGPGRR